MWLAWESFGDLNGTDTFAEMAARIEAIRAVSCTSKGRYSDFAKNSE